MMTEIKKSINSYLHEKVTSPFFGAFICSWLVVNWKIVYLTFVIKSDEIVGTKIDYIVNNYSDWKFIYLYPFLSSIVIVSLIPFLSTGAYWLKMKFKQWRIKIKQNIEKKQLLDAKQANEIRFALERQNDEYNSLLITKEKEIGELHNTLTEYSDKTKDSELEINSLLAKSKDDENKYLKLQKEFEDEIISTQDKIKSLNNQIFKSNRLLAGKDIGILKGEKNGLIIDDRYRNVREEADEFFKVDMNVMNF